ncbi:hypothetical protein KPH14_002252 [Odynerus spinipes]|uniref:Uncharacterized protein n=1 Tax=Odynerus spinipes TaxID=1348599 RepID=A0AAD9RLF6_9HYME|nr:hypothetical protein KPH14_002252 [Odynerus spinipes]
MRELEKERGRQREGKQGGKEGKKSRSWESKKEVEGGHFREVREKGTRGTTEDNRNKKKKGRKQSWNSLGRGVSEEERSLKKEGLGGVQRELWSLVVSIPGLLGGALVCASWLEESKIVGTE